MNTRRLRLTAALLLALAAMLWASVPGALAYMAVESNALVNRFTATYVPPKDTTAEIRVVKTVVSTGAKTIGPQGFMFALENADTGETITLTADENGSASATIAFTAADRGREHVYRLREIDDGREGVTYSDAEYEIRFALSVDAENRLVAAARVDGAQAEQVVLAFENVYSGGVALPNTGDDSRLGLYIALLLLSCGAALLLRRAHRRGMK